MKGKCSFLALRNWHNLRCCQWQGGGSGGLTCVDDVADRPRAQGVIERDHHHRIRIAGKLRDDPLWRHVGQGSGNTEQKGGLKQPGSVLWVLCQGGSVLALRMWQANGLCLPTQFSRPCSPQGILGLQTAPGRGPSSPLAEGAAVYGAGLGVDAAWLGCPFSRKGKAKGGGGMVGGMAWTKDPHFTSSLPGPTINMRGQGCSVVHKPLSTDTSKTSQSRCSPLVDFGQKHQ